MESEILSIPTPKQGAPKQITMAKSPTKDYQSSSKDTSHYLLYFHTPTVIIFFIHLPKSLIIAVCHKFWLNLKVGYI